MSTLTETFDIDLVQSRRKDSITIPMWDKYASSDRVVLNGRETTIRTIGSEIVFQESLKHEEKVDVSIDTKQIRGIYDNILVEHFSNSISLKPGWVWASTADIIAYNFWPNCKGCYKNCLTECEKDVKDILPVYFNFISLPKLRRWFKVHRLDYGCDWTKQHNHSLYYFVPVADLLQNDLVICKGKWDGVGFTMEHGTL